MWLIGKTDVLNTPFLNQNSVPIIDPEICDRTINSVIEYDTLVGYYAITPLN